MRTTYNPTALDLHEHGSAGIASGLWRRRASWLGLWFLVAFVMLGVEATPLSPFVETTRWTLLAFGVAALALDARNMSALTHAGSLWRLALWMLGAFLAAPGVATFGFVILAAAEATGLACRIWSSRVRVSEDVNREHVLLDQGRVVSSQASTTFRGDRAAQARRASAGAVSSRSGQLVGALRISGAVVVALGITHLGIEWLLASRPEQPLLATVVNAVAREAGLAAYRSGDVVTHAQVLDPTAITVTWERIGTAWILVIVAVAAWTAFRSTLAGMTRAVSLATAVCAVGCVATIPLYIAIESSSGQSFLARGALWQLVPVGAVLAVLALLERRPGAPDLVAGKPRNPGVGFAAAASATFALCVDACGPVKGGRIAIDEHHSDWTSSEHPMNRTEYGTESTYTYSCMLESIRRNFASVRALHESLSERSLEDVDVLVAKMPTRPYSEEELDALVQFVERGGGLWLIGDHTNVFGTSSCLNAIASRFGCRYRDDGLDEIQPQRQVYQRPALGAHAIVSQVPAFCTATSCSLEVPWSAQRVMIGSGLLADAPDYGIYNFFGDHAMSPDEPFGSFVQMACLGWGNGRVALFTDSTIFSNFSFNYPGRIDLCLSTVEWLNRENGSPAMRSGLRLWALLGAGICAWVVWRNRASGVGVAGLFIATGAIAGSWLSDETNQRTYSGVRARDEQNVVAFVTAGSDYKLPVTQTTRPNDAWNFDTFYVWLPRLGLRPTVANSVQDIGQAVAAVVIRPRGGWAPEDVESLHQFVAEGGRLLVLDDGPKDEHATTNMLLEPFGMLVEPYEALSSVRAPSSFKASLWDGRVVVKGGLAVRGGIPVLESQDGTCVAAWNKVGQGRVAVCGVAQLFRHFELGDVRGTPDDRQLALAKLEFALFDDVLGLALR